MVGFEDDYSLYMGGNKLEKGAFVSVRVFGKINSSQSLSLIHISHLSVPMVPAKLLLFTLSPVFSLLKKEVLFSRERT